MADKDANERALAAVNDASGQVAAVWVTLLLLGTYLAIAIGSTTHVDLLLEKALKLPLLGVDLGLFTFYWAAPLLFLIFHLYFLIQLYILSGKAHAFNALIAQDTIKSDRDALRERLHVFMLTQALAGPRRSLFPRLLLRFTLWLTAVLAPLILLLLMQIRFLPYHSEPITWWHRTTIVLDLLFVWSIWPLILHPNGAMIPFLHDMIKRRRMPAPIQDEIAAPTEPGRRRLARQLQLCMQAPGVGMVLLLLSLTILPFAVLIATIPNESIERRLLAWAPHGTAWSEKCLPRKEDSIDLKASTDEPACSVISKIIHAPTVVQHGERSMLYATWWLFEGDVDPVTHVQDSWASRNLVIIDTDVVDDDAFVKAATSIDLHGRRLEYANFTGSDLHKVNFSGAKLTHAVLRDANLQGAVFASAREASLDRYTNLEWANLEGAMLQGAKLWQANLRDATLRHAQFQGADLGRVMFRGDLADAFFAGALLGDADFSGVHGLPSTAFNGASWNNRKESEENKQMIQCANEVGLIDIRFLASPPWPSRCRRYEYPKPDVDEVLRQFRWVLANVKDPVTQAEVIETLGSMLSGEKCWHTDGTPAGQARSDVEDATRKFAEKYGVVVSCTQQNAAHADQGDNVQVSSQQEP